MNKNPLDAMERFVALLDAPEPSFARLVERRERRRRRRQVAAGAGATTTLAGFVAAMVWVLPIGTDPSRDSTSVASADRVMTAPATTEPAVVEPAPQPPVEFTACNVDTDVESVGSVETVTIPGPDGETTLHRSRGGIITQVMSDVSDPRLDGTWALAWNEDDYQGPQGAASANILTVILRIENDEGAWQGTDLVVRHGPNSNWPGDAFHLALTGEGAYEGLTAAMVYQFGVDCPSVRGYILELGVPAAEATFPLADDQPTTTNDP